MGPDPGLVLSPSCFKRSTPEPAPNHSNQTGSAFAGRAGWPAGALPRLARASSHRPLRCLHGHAGTRPKSTHPLHEESLLEHAVLHVAGPGELSPRFAACAARAQEAAPARRRPLARIQCQSLGPRGQEVWPGRDLYTDLPTRGAQPASSTPRDPLWSPK